MKQMSKRLLSLLLCTVLALGMLPGAVWAEDEAISVSSQTEDEIISDRNQAEGEIISENNQEDGALPVGNPEEQEALPINSLAEDVMPFVSSLAIGEVTTISTEAELRAITDMAGSYKLTNDIVSTGEWAPIGSSATPFTGIFDGGGYAIKGLKINAGTSTYQGLFGKIGVGGVVRDLTVEGIINSTQTSNAYIGGVAGQVQGGSIINCVSKVQISAASAKKIGGIVGDTLGATEIIGCANLSPITAYFAVGGVIGSSAGTTTITNCYNTGEITTTNNNCGGVVGSVGGTVTIQNCYNADKGKRTGTINSGALIGLLNSASTAKNCYWLKNESLPGIGNGNVGKLEDCSEKEESQLKAINFLDIINTPDVPDDSRFTPDPGGLNDGYPVLECQLPKVEKFQVTFDVTPKNAVLTVKDSKEASQIGANGVYRLPAGNYRYSASAFGFRTTGSDFTVVDENNPGTISVALEEAGRQTVTFTGLPQGAVLTVSHAVAGQIMPEHDGGYRLPAGDYTYSIIAKGYEPLVNQTLKVEGGAVTVPVTMTSLGAAPAWDGTAKTTVTPIGGTYYVKSGAELAWFAGEINDEKRLLDARVVLLADINLGNKDWKSVGGYDRKFNGSFDGNGCVISGLAGNCYGLFYAVDTVGIIENLTVLGSITGTSNTGGIVGVNSGTVKNCAANVMVAVDGQRAGGVVGNNSSGLISGCAALAPVSSSYNSTNINKISLALGGVTGQSSGTVEHSYNAAAVTAKGTSTNGLGGIGGVSGANTGNIKNCYNIGVVSYADTHGKSTAGAVVDENNGTVQNSYYLEGSCSKGVGSGSTDGVQSKTSTEMKAYALVIALNDGSVDGPFYAAADASQNGGCPVLKWQGGKAPVASPDELAVAADKADLKLSQLVYTYAGTIKLPANGTSGSAISWASSVPDVISAAGSVIPPASGKTEVILTATLEKGAAQDTKSFTLTVYSAAQVTLNYVEEAKSSLGTILRPVCGRDTNIVELIQDMLADRGFGDVAVVLKDPGVTELGGGTYIAADGAVTYYYRDPSGTSAYNGAIVRKISFTLSKDGQSVNLENVSANIPWDRDKVIKTLQDEVASKLTWDAIKNKNGSSKEITTPLILPLKLDAAKWATISWESDSWAIVPKESQNPLETETTGTINRQSVDAQVNLTAVIRFNLTASGEKDITVSVPFDLIVLGSEGADTPEKMQKKLESYTLERLKDSITKVQLNSAAVTGDIQFPTPANTGVADYSAYRFTVTSKNTDVLEVNGYRGYVYRPLPGKNPVTVGFTVTMTSRANPTLSASKDMAVTVLPLEQKEIDEALRLMEAVRADYANALLGTNTDKGAITSDLKTFREAIFGSDGQSLIYSRKLVDDTDRGVLVDDLPGSGPGGPGYEQWRVFRSSRPDIMAHEVLRLTQPVYDTTVTVESCLTHEVLGKYARKHPGNRDFAALCQVPILATFTVKGSSGETNPNPDRTFSVAFSLDGRGYIESIPAVSIGGLKSGATAFDVFRQVLAGKGFSYEGSGMYVSAVTDSKGKRLAHFDKGESSGWMYTVNGVFPNTGMNAYYLSGGEDITFLYTADWKQEPGVSGGMVKPPVSGTVLNPIATVGKNGEAKAEISAKDMESAVAEAKKTAASNIVIEPTVKGDNVSKVTMTLPKESLTTIVRETSASLTVKTTFGDVSIPKEVLSSIVSQAAGSTIDVAVGLAEKKTLTEAQQKLVGDAKVYDISILSGGKNISSFDGKSLTISLPYKLKAGEIAESVAVWYLSDKGELEKMTCKYDKATGLATFTTSHLSKYLVGYSEVWKNLFSDVKEKDWFYSAVEYAVKNGLFNGTTATTFSPNGQMTRSMLVTVLYRVEGSPSVTGTNGFSDVKSGQWYTDAIIWANEKGIVSGLGNGLFGTDNDVTREQMATILYNYAKYKGYNTAKMAELNAFTDALAVSAWAQPAVKWASAEGLVTGRTAATLAPKGNATRAEVAAIFQRFIPAFQK